LRYSIKGRSLWVAIATFFIFCAPSYAAYDANEILKAVVKISSTIPENAYTAPLLGTEREGTGVIIDSNGLILTIGYLILEATDVEITGTDDKKTKAHVIGYDPETGFGLVRADHSLRVSPMRLGLSSEIKEKAPLLIASHGGRESVLGVRVISRQEYVGYWEYLLEDAIFTTPPHSNYGGAALIDREGRLVGIGSLYSVLKLPEIGSIPCNMFVPIDRIKPILNDMITKGRSTDRPRPWLGIFSQETYGRIIITRVSPGGPAEQAGLKQGDIILKVDDYEVGGLADFYRKVWELGNAGVGVPLSVLQGTQINHIIVRSSSLDRFLNLNPRDGS
jgi:S1-C subfamily serine protease